MFKTEAALYWRAVRRHWGSGLTGVTGFVIATVFAGFGLWGPWAIAAAIALVGLLTAQYLAWRDMRGERDQAATAMAALAAQLLQKPPIKYALTLELFHPQIGIPEEHDPETNAADCSMIVNLTFRNGLDVPLDYDMEQLDVSLDGGGALTGISGRGGVMLPGQLSRFTSWDAIPNVRIERVYYGHASFSAVYFLPDDPDSQRYRMTYSFRFGMHGVIGSESQYEVRLTEQNGPHHELVV